MWRGELAPPVLVMISEEDSTLVNLGFRYKDGIGQNLLALSYTIAGFGLGIYLLFVHKEFLNGLGVLLLTHTLAYSAFFIHELIHGTIFQKTKTNLAFATMFSWMNGSCYANILDMKKKHLQHHANRADIISFDFRQFLQEHAVIRYVVLVLEWIHIPAVEFIMRTFVVLAPFTGKASSERRTKMIAMLLIRTLVFIEFAIVSLKAFILYWISYLLFVHFVRFIDAFQHTYDVFVMEQPIDNDTLRDRAYEDDNTYSNLISFRYPLLNLLTLNFVYHNAHHTKPGAPWHRLPQLHQTLYADRPAEHVIPFGTLLLNFHKYRLRRVVNDNYGEVETNQVENFTGAVGVSFLTAI